MEVTGKFATTTKKDYWICDLEKEESHLNKKYPFRLIKWSHRINLGFVPK